MKTIVKYFKIPSFYYSEKEFLLHFIISFSYMIFNFKDIFLNVYQLKIY